MPGASISVMGTTFYESTWFGWAVQWVGLVYAEALRELARFDPAPEWRRIADLITASALHQQKTEGVPCGHVGFYPDSYSLLTGKDAYEWCIAPMGIVNNVIGRMGLAWEPCVFTLNAGDHRVFVLSAGRVTCGTWESAANRTRLTIRCVPGQAGQVVVFGLREPARVTWGGKPLDRIAAEAVGSEGWFAPSRERALAFRLRWSGEEQELILEGAQPTAYAPPEEIDRLFNGGFEEGIRGWRCDPGAQIDRANPHGGQAALQIRSPDARQEGQAWGEPFRIEGGRRYRLRAWVRQIEGDGDYKVTVEWLGAGGEHLRYDNDWMGADRPREYREHGGVFLAPSGAFQARIILGCRGAICLFDDITLEPAG
jgi:hypothetical protein